MDGFELTLRTASPCKAYDSWCPELRRLLGGSRVSIGGVTSRVTIIITHIRGLITLLITSHEPPSMAPNP